MADLKEFQRKMEKTLDVLASDFAAVRAAVSYTHLTLPTILLV